MDDRQLTYYNKLKQTAEAEGWTLVTEIYVDSRTKMWFKCPKGHLSEKNAGSFTSYRGCPVCSGSSKDTARESFYELMKREGYQAISEYINKNTKVDVICPKGHKYNIRPDSFKRGDRCVQCYRDIPKKAFFDDVENSGYKVIGEYIDASTKVLIKCPHNHIYEILPCEFKRGTRCRECYGRTPEQSKENFLKVAKERDYTIYGEYVYNSTPVGAICPEGHDIKITPDALKDGGGCAKCAGRCPIQAKEDFLDLVKKEGYTLHSEYIDSRFEVLLKCPFEHTYKVLPYSFKNGHRCTNCPRNESKGEKAVRLSLESLGISCTVQQRFTFFPNVRYDVYFVYKNRHYALEFDGGEHFYYLPLMHKDNIINFYRSQYYDILKTYLAMQNSLTIIRISYKEEKDIHFHVQQAISCESPWYFSNNEIYHYIINPSLDLYQKCQFDDGVLRRYK